MPLNKLSNPLKIVLGVATIWPFLYIPFFIAMVFSTIALSITAGDNSFPLPLLIILPLHFLTIILQLVVLGLFIIDIFKNGKIKNDKKALWAIVIFLGGPIASPIYWYLYIWKVSSKKR